jgi:hypothetical protein
LDIVSLFPPLFPLFFITSYLFTLFFYYFLSVYSLFLSIPMLERTHSFEFCWYVLYALTKTYRFLFIFMDVSWVLS